MTNNERKKIISALRQLLAMCDFVDQYGDCIDADPYFNAVETAIKSLNETMWIPVSKRLPEEKDAGILKKLGIKKMSEYVLATVEIKDERMTAVACTHDGKWNWDKKYAFPDFKVVAWMPFPKSYREDSKA